MGRGGRIGEYGKNRRKWRRETGGRRGGGGREEEAAGGGGGWESGVDWEGGEPMAWRGQRGCSGRRKEGEKEGRR